MPINPRKRRSQGRKQTNRPVPAVSLEAPPNINASLSSDSQGISTKAICSSTGTSVLVTVILSFCIVASEYLFAVGPFLASSQRLDAQGSSSDIARFRSGSQNHALVVPADVHSSHLELVDLLEWELISLQGISADNESTATTKADRDARAAKTCQPSKGVPRTCCLGSFSRGGLVETRYRSECGSPLNSNLGRLREAAQTFFEEHPISRTNHPIIYCDICEILEVARHKNLSIVLMGDSMQSQVMDGMACEMARRHYQIFSDVTTTPTNVTQERNQYHKHSSTRILKIKSPLWSKKDDSVSSIVTIRYHNIYMVPLNELGGDFLALTAEADVLVMGFGLHWNSGPVYNGKTEFDYVRSMAETFTSLAQQNHVQLLVHRESSAQHYDTDHAGEWNYWDRRPKNERSNECHPTTSNSTGFYWRERALARAANRSGYTLVLAGPSMPPLATTPTPELVVLPYYNFTSSHPHMHPHRDANSDDDCTHFCSSPYLYYPLWRSLRFAMDRQFQNG